MGRRAESATADYLCCRGWTILGQNVRVGSYELDLVALDGDVLCFIEVRTRGSRGAEGALESIRRAKRKRLVAAASAAAPRYFALTNARALRMDVAVVTHNETETTVEYLAGALRADEV